MNISTVGNGKVVLIAGGGKIYTDIAARFCKSEKALDDIIASPYNANIVKNILSSGHKAATEFDYFIFGIEGYSRVTEVQLVRKRLASYLIKSGRAEKNGKRSFDVVLPKSIQGESVFHDFDPSKVIVNGKDLCDTFPGEDLEVSLLLDTNDILDIIEDWYDTAVASGVPEEEARYMKPQATECKAIIGMNAHALMDWFQIRCCMNAQTEIRDLAHKMMALCKEAAPDLFAQAGPSCKVLGYCPENDRQNKACQGNILTKDQAMKILNEYKKE